jgi:hypothetical protein
METSRDDSTRACPQCGTPLPNRSGGGRQADYCSRACQGRAYRARLAARHETSRDETEWAALTARAVDSEAEAASLREQLAAAQHRVDELAAELAAARAVKDTAGARQKTQTPAAAATGTPALPPPIKPGSGTRRYTQTGTSAWDVYVDDIPIGTVRLLSGKYWPTLPNGFEVYMGGAASDLDDAAHKLAMAYNGWSGYWHAESAATLKLLRPQRDGARTVKWGGLSIGRVRWAAAAGYGGDGTVAITPRDGALRGPQGPARFEDEQQAAEALLKHWQADHTPPWGGLDTA